MKFIFKPGIYQHYSGKLYHAIAVSRHSETLEEMVLYRALYDDYGLWVRPKKMFTEMVLINDVLMPRFKYIKSIDIDAPLLIR